MSELKLDPVKLAFDIDGVVADTMASFINIAKKDFGITSLKKEHITSYWLEECLPVPEETVNEIIKKILSDPFGTGLVANSGAVGALTAISTCAPLLFVTARPIGHPIEMWIRNLLSGVEDNYIKVVATGRHDAKLQVLKECGIKFFVEDHLETCQELSANGICGIVYDQPWNRYGDACMRIDSWGALLELIDV